jgi:hypothetical protein
MFTTFLKSMLSRRTEFNVQHSVQRFGHFQLSLFINKLYGTVYSTV